MVFSLTINSTPRILVLSCPCPRFFFGQSFDNSVAFFTFQQSTYSPSYHFHLRGLGLVRQEDEKHKYIFRIHPPQQGLTAEELLEEDSASRPSATARSPGLARALRGKHPGLASAQSLPGLLDAKTQGSAEKEEGLERGGRAAEENETPSRLTQPSGTSAAWGPRRRGLRNGRTGLHGAETPGSERERRGGEEGREEWREEKAEHPGYTYTRAVGICKGNKDGSYTTLRIFSGGKKTEPDSGGRPGTSQLLILNFQACYHYCKEC